MRRLLLVIAVLGVAVAPAAAAPNGSTTTSTNATVVAGGHPVAVDGVMTIQGWEYENGRFNVTLTASQYHVATLAASARASDRVAHSPYRQVVLQGGESTTVSIPADRVDGEASVSVTTGACIQSGSCPTVYSDDTSLGSPFGGSPTLGWLGGAGIAVLSMVAGALYVVRRGGAEPREAR
ncbi:hypothetical protein EFA46_007615 [Halarchaeum sp. CBA1220]|uniref:hypothetical protein n=1 Tax=Halarchaeum sp. CBA1220 TaxID=1853682 RepID=UPI0011CE651F|nr:hypothetical protein [Halarchaeum sp. CBA1220]QLC34076.1 hypothetical protein EFA46_007615 [Halarchaeum sp. CBA1220]